MCSTCWTGCRARSRRARCTWPAARPSPRACASRWSRPNASTRTASPDSSCTSTSAARGDRQAGGRQVLRLQPEVDDRRRAPRRATACRSGVPRDHRDQRGGDVAEQEPPEHVGREADAEVHGRERHRDDHEQEDATQWADDVRRHRHEERGGDRDVDVTGTPGRRRSARRCRGSSRRWVPRISWNSSLPPHASRPAAAAAPARRRGDAARGTPARRRGSPTATRARTRLGHTLEAVGELVDGSEEVGVDLGLRVGPHRDERERDRTDDDLADVDRAAHGCLGELAHPGHPGAAADVGVLACVLRGEAVLGARASGTGRTPSAAPSTMATMPASVGPVLAVDERRLGRPG